MELPSHQFITSQKAWQSCLEILQEHPSIALDLEANSMYAYRERICLIQISVPTQDYIIDPLSSFDLTALGSILSDTNVQKVFHAAEYDLLLMKREYHWELNNLFDTMWAARILGYKRYGLANLLDTVFGIQISKQYQKSNWCKRPLSPEQLNYAQHDTHHLLALRDHFQKELDEAGRNIEALEIFADQTKVHPNNHDFDPDSFWSIHGVNELSGTQQAVLKKLNIYRDKEAQKRNQPLFKIFGDKTLFQLAQNMPRNYDELRPIYGMTPRQIKRFGKPILRIIDRSQHDPQPARPKRAKRPSDAVICRYEKLHYWRKTRAQKRGVESDVILSRDCLWDIARQNPHSADDLFHIETLGTWRRQTYGKEILSVLQK
ncbi:MAG: 3'-5' exonuclease [Chloroflexi bacterium]|nr:MAG: 3'-5' exonuclease [Chloroflexota bacterium]